jgi:hypothetical protein
VGGVDPLYKGVATIRMVWRQTEPNQRSNAQTVRSCLPVTQRVAAEIYMTSSKVEFVAREHYLLTLEADHDETHSFLR